MLLRFIGKDGSMNLIRGRAYDVFISRDYRYIYVNWYDDTDTVVRCPYASPEAFALNWRACSK